MKKIHQVGFDGRMSVPPEKRFFISWRGDICNERLTICDGEMLIPDKPGLVIELDNAEMAKHPHEPRDLTDIRPDDMAPYYRLERWIISDQPTVT